MSDVELIKSLLVDTHETIEQYSNDFVEDLGNGSNLVYPPGIELNTAQQEAFSSIQLSEDQSSVLKVAIKDLCANVIVDMLSKIDGVSDPKNFTKEVWLGLTLHEKSGDQWQQMLHDQFFEEYWSFKEGTS